MQYDGTVPLSMQCMHQVYTGIEPIKVRCTCHVACLRRSEQHVQHSRPAKQPRLRPVGTEVVSKTKGTASSPNLWTSIARSIALASDIHHAAET
jgi:hypothetical protein